MKDVKETQKHSPAFTDEKHPEVYSKFTKTKIRKPGQLTDEQFKELNEKGFILIKDFFPKELLDAAKRDIEGLVDKLANKLYNGGKIKNKHENVGFYRRLIKLEEEFKDASILLHKTGDFPESFQKIATYKPILNLVEDFIGPNIMFSPIWNLRTKTPNNPNTVVPWHQDAAYGDNHWFKNLVMTAWIPLLDATAQNGTMQMVKNCHKEAKVALHQCCQGPTWYVMLDEKEMEDYFKCNVKEDAEIMEVPYGSFLLFQNFTPHRSLPNTSDYVRWALDFRWQDNNEDPGFFGLKKGIQLTGENDENFTPDWTPFTSVDRHWEQLKDLQKDSGIESKPDEFNTELGGPWMKRWEIVNENRHTSAYRRDH